jgi:murein DD-endopeptidase MepM/ murein hydrolase activator NlpD
LTAHSRYPHATPSPRLVAGRLLRQSSEDLHSLGAALAVATRLVFGRRIPAFAAALYGPNGLKFVLNVATALLVLSLPLSVAQSTGAFTTAEAPTVAASVTAISDEGAARASSVSRGLLAGSRNPTTVAAQDTPAVQRYAVQTGDTLTTVAEHFSIAANDLAYANGIEDEGAVLSVGAELIIPPGRGALYFVKDGDTVASVAAKFKVEQAVIMTYNRLYFEPEHFATEQLIFVPGAEVPAMKRATVTRAIPIPTVGQLPARTGQLSWPVRGVLTQHYWWGHSGVDIAAPYGTGIAASDAGVVVATGWVAVGGLRVCVQHEGGLQTCYYHTSAVYVTPGEVVARGQLIAAIGMTGVTTGPHVHWEAKLNGATVNPLAY